MLDNIKEAFLKAYERYCKEFNYDEIVKKVIKEYEQY